MIYSLGSYATEPGLLGFSYGTVYTMLVKKKTIISPLFLTLEKKFLQHTPSTILTAPSAGRALALACEHQPSLVFMVPDGYRVEFIDIPVKIGFALRRYIGQ